jgi:hypothetical protein
MQYQLNQPMNHPKKWAVKFISVLTGSVIGIVAGFYIGTLEFSSVAAAPHLPSVSSSSSLKVEPINPSDQAVTAQQLQQTVNDSRLQ